MARLLSFLLVVLVMSSCGRSKPPRPEWSEDPALQRLMVWLEGDFDNTASLADPGRQGTEEHVPIEVHVRRLPNVPNAFYVEQASMEKPDKPYRQRVYILAKVGKTFVSRVHTLKDPARWVNAHHDPSVLSDLTMDGVDYKDGCDVVLKWNGERYVGGTQGKGCATDLNGASYATAEIEVFDGGFSSWDRGFDAAGVQVWGARKLPYLFARTRAGGGR